MLLNQLEVVHLPRCKVTYPQDDGWLELSKFGAYLETDEAGEKLNEGGNHFGYVSGGCFNSRTNSGADPGIEPTGKGYQ
jgi:hypothetical protein